MQTAVKRRAERWAAALLLAAALAGCDQLPTPPSPAGAPEQMSQQQLARAVQALGFRSEGMIDQDDYVIVEGDIRLDKSRLASRLPAGTGRLSPSFQFHHTELVSSPLIHQVTVDLTGWNDDIKEAARAAMAEWNQVQGSYIRMVEGSPGLISVRLDCFGYTGRGEAAYTYWPAGGMPGRAIVLNECYTGSILTKAERRAVFLHHLGHAVGFQHADWLQHDDPSQGGGAVHVPGTPYSGGDDASIMVMALTNLELSHYDRVAASRVYPLPPPTVTVVNDGGHPRISWNYPLAANGQFSVRLLHNRYDRYGRLPPETVNEVTLLTEGVGATTFHDTQRQWTGTSNCSVMTSNYTRKEAWLYEVTIHYANGAAAGTWHAPVGAC